MSTKLLVFKKKKRFSSIKNWASLADVILVVWATYVSEYPTCTLLVMQEWTEI